MSENILEVKGLTKDYGDFVLDIDHLRRERFHTGVLPESCQLPLIR